MIGNLIRIKKFRHQLDDKQWVEYAAPKGKVFVALVLAVEDTIPPEGITADDRLNALGWKFDEGE